ncbi:MAG: hypothetical protein OEM15_12805 [Myxococcales bacterium]|nr:hypothetical protein [Myxococcales bacterium]MDH3485479.1 hypothetical protein [Myxococcales bacterium]
MTQHRFTLGACLLALLVSCGCKKDKATPPPPELSVSMVEAGDEPRKVLRYAIAPGTVVRSVLQVRTASTTTEDLQDTFGLLPGVRLDLHAGPTVAFGDQGIRYVLRISRATPILPEGTEEDRLEGAQEGVRALNGMRGRFDLSDRGIVMDSDVPWTQGQERIHPRVTIMLGNVRSAVATVPLPVEPVGVGAVWEVRRSVRLWSAWVTQVTRYELVDRTGDRFRVRIGVRQSAPAQVADLNPKLEMHVRTYEMQGEGHALVDLGLPIALEAELESHSEADIALVSPEETEPIQSARHSVLRLTTKRER